MPTERTTTNTTASNSAKNTAKRASTQPAMKSASTATRTAKAAKAAKKGASRTSRPSSTTVLFVRHGQTPTTGNVLPGRAKGLHLAEAGHQQAAAVADRIAARGKVHAIYTSPLERTRETAAPIAKRLGLKAVTERGLLECDFGDWTGKRLDRLRKLPAWSTVQRYPSGFRFPNGESFAEMQTRMTGTIALLRHRHPRGTVVVVSHADPIKAAVADALGTHLDLFQRIVISPCSVTTIAYGNGGPVVLAVNSTTGDLPSEPS